MGQMLDQQDKRILDVLQNDASVTVAELADRVGLSRNACWRRVRDLETKGIIRGRVALLDPDKLNVGMTAFIAIRTNHHTPAWLEAFQSAAKDLPEIVGVYRMTGDVDYLVEAVIPDVKAYDELYKRLIARIELSDVSSSFVMENIKRTTALPLAYG